MNTTDLNGLKAIALDQQSKVGIGRHEARARAQALVDAIDLVQAFDTETGDWVACLRCSLAFPTDKQHSDHYWAAHRYGSHR